MNVFRLFLFTLLFGLFSTTASAQAYTESVGIRGAYPSAISYKGFINPTDAVELYVGWRGWRRYGAVSLNGAYQRHQDLPEVDNLYWYYGAGAGVQFWSYDDYDRGSATLSLSGYLGLEYVFPDTPITLGLDWRPTIYLGTQRAESFHNFSGFSGGLAVRYILP
ncbi:hypothetical protein [Lewinella sp. IMCC34183]|uniref:hypothetical protein n=1 Tax=Lewinella sp. IMCC34183 TaxID=2248762 RepID=UPI000E255837|nr:hypothetical protein [Lewinella sp. IMCC34183]